MTAAGDTGTESASGRGHRWDAALEVFAFVAPTTLLTGVLYYFGLVSARAYYSYFGVSLSALDFSTTTYVARSADTFFKPAATFLLVLAVAFGAHHLLKYVLGDRDHGWGRGLGYGLIGLSLVTLGVGLAGLYGIPRGLWSPLSLAASGLLFEYGLWVLSTYGRPAPAIKSLAVAGIYLRRGLIAAMVFIATFWAVTNIAQDRGTANARLAELSLRLQPQAVVYSERDLHLLPGRGIGLKKLDGEDSAYRYRYNGLRPLVYSNDRWFLLPVGWTRTNGATVIVLLDDPSRVRVDLAPSSR
ncbi:hypothetical protein FB561_0117 [Kribbella amoyensis]|uniref:Uncharacterized protein n=1 Tax=Kribbella amoyensis TaxID=996641 RepID=A0A561BJN0_9ACTN|nr:hypothetical protein [Kribbella amoyensis]TWD79067.1 hypothetical protein FB561_0117 [Kribbella amoyensis]